MPETRTAQLAYSEGQALMLDETSRRAKAAKMAAVIEHFRGVSGLDGLRIVDCGCSGGIIDDELRLRGATVVGLDIDQPGLRRARKRFGDTTTFLCADAQQIPLADASADVVICNHIYEHVLDPPGLFDELRRVVRPDGLLYLGLANRLGVIEPHYRLPFLSWLPRSWAHRYVRTSGRADRYHEELTTWSGLRRLCGGLQVWDYTLSVLAQPDEFAARDAVPGWATRAPLGVLRTVRRLIPTYVWIATTGPSRPKGAVLRMPPSPIATPRR